MGQSNLFERAMELRPVLDLERTLRARPQVAEHLCRPDSVALDGSVRKLLDGVAVREPVDRATGRAAHPRGVVHSAKHSHGRTPDGIRRASLWEVDQSRNPRGYPKARSMAFPISGPRSGEEVGDDDQECTDGGQRDRHASPPGCELARRLGCLGDQSSDGETVGLDLEAVPPDSGSLDSQDSRSIDASRTWSSSRLFSSWSMSNRWRCSRGLSNSR